MLKKVRTCLVTYPTTFGNVNVPQCNIFSESAVYVFKSRIVYFSSVTTSLTPSGFQLGKVTPAGTMFHGFRNHMEPISDSGTSDNTQRAA